jgi:hypothetical protein
MSRNSSADVVAQPYQDFWQIDREAMEAFATPVGFVSAIFIMGLVSALYLLVGPGSQRPMVWPVIGSLVFTFIPVFVPILLGHADYVCSRRGKWLRAIDFVANPAPALALGVTASAEFPVAALVLVGFAILWPAQHPRNIAACVALVALPLLTRWVFLPNSTPATYLFLVGIGSVSVLLYLRNSYLIDRFRAVRQVLSVRQDRLTEATAAQHSLRVAMSLHDGLSGLAAVAERNLQLAPQGATSIDTMAVLRKRLQQEIAGAQDETSLRTADLVTTAATVGVTCRGMEQLAAWDAVSAQDMLDVLNELISNCARHGTGQRSTGAIVIDQETVTIDIKTPSPKSYSVRGRGLRNVAYRIVNAGGDMSVNTANGEFHIAAHVPNRRTAYAPPFVKMATPSLAVLAVASLACMALLPAWFAWPQLLTQIVLAFLHLYQLQSDSTKQRAVYERTENALLTLHIDQRQRLVAARLGHHQQLLAESNTALLIQHLAAFRLELNALLFALEWQGDSAALAQELGLAHCVIPQEDRVNAIHALALQAVGRRITG